MSVGALSLPPGVSLVTIADHVPPAWAGLFGSASATHIPMKADTQAERNLLAARLDSAVRSADRVLLAAHGASCFATAWWGRLSPSDYVAKVAGALFFQPVDDDAAEVDHLLMQFASPRTRLPFPSIVLGADARAGQVRRRVSGLARSWGSGAVVVRDPDEGGPLRRTLRAIDRFTASVVERDIDLAAARLRG